MTIINSIESINRIRNTKGEIVAEYVNRTQSDIFVIARKLSDESGEVLSVFTNGFLALQFRPNELYSTNYPKLS